MLKYLKLLPILLVVSAAEAKPVKTEFVTGTGLVWAAPNFVLFDVDVSQLDPDDPVGWMVATFDAFPQHTFMTLEATGFTALAVDKQTALVTGTALVNDARSGFEGEVEFSAVFEDSRRKRQQRDRMSLTLYLPTGTETFAGTVATGGVVVGTRKR